MEGGAWVPLPGLKRGLGRQRRPPCGCGTCMCMCSLIGNKYGCAGPFQHGAGGGRATRWRKYPMSPPLCQRVAACTRAATATVSPWSQSGWSRSAANVLLTPTATLTLTPDPTQASIATLTPIPTPSTTLTPSPIPSLFHNLNLLPNSTLPPAPTPARARAGGDPLVLCWACLTYNESWPLWPFIMNCGTSSTFVPLLIN